MKLLKGRSKDEKLQCEEWCEKREDPTEKVEESCDCHVQLETQEISQKDKKITDNINTVAEARNLH